MATITPTIIPAGVFIGISPTLAHDRADRHRLAGTVTVDGLPAKKRIVVTDRTTFVPCAFTLSNPVTGAWEIYGLPEYPLRSLMVIAIDDTGNFNAELADCVSQVTA